MAWWLRVSNAAHATAWPRPVVQAVSLLAQGMALLGPGLWAWMLFREPATDWKAYLKPVWESGFAAGGWGWYGLFCVFWAVKTVLSWAWVRCTLPPQALRRQKLLHYHRPLLPWPQESRSQKTNRSGLGLVFKQHLLRLPGNQMLDLEVNEKHLAVPGLPEPLHHLRVVHLSDLHLWGGVPREYFLCLGRCVQQLEPHLVVLTGDLVEKADYLPWLAELLTQWEASLGTWVVWGNHDRRVCQRRLRQTVESTPGAKCLVGKQVLLSYNGGKILLAGSAWPWFGPRPEPAPHSKDTLGLLLSHSPDEFYWAARNGYRLVLAGHLHGGQIRFPVLGPLVAPSRYGTWFASGVFQHRRCVMHVSRGISGVFPLRVLCPPELSCLVLQGE